MIKKIFAIAVLITVLPSIAYAILPTTYTTYSGSVTCQDCRVGSCTCVISGCGGGLLRIWSVSGDCTGIWDYEYALSGTSARIQPIEEGTLYARVFDGNQYCTACDTFTVSGIATATATETTTETTEVTIDTETTTEPPTTGGDMTWTIFLILFIILVIGAVVYYFFFMKKKTSKKVKTYEDLYKKWPRRR